MQVVGIYCQGERVVVVVVVASHFYERDKGTRRAAAVVYV